jgi:hypothetical protein
VALKMGIATRSAQLKAMSKVIAAAIVLLGAWLRFAYVSGPYTQPDEPIAPWVVAHVLSSPGLDTNWAHTPIRGDFGAAQYNFSSYYLSLTLLQWLRDMTGSHPLLEGIGARIVFFRICSAGFGTLGLALAMGLAFRIQDWSLASGVGLWMAVNPLLVQDSHYARPEAFLVLMTLVLLWICRSRRLAPGWRSLMAGLIFGFLVACKVTLLLWFWLPFLACFMDEGDWRSCPRAQRLARLGLVVAGALGGFVAGLPRVLSDLGGYLTGLNLLRSEYGHSILYSSHFPSAAVYDFLGRYLIETVGWGIACFFVIGLADAIVRRRWRLILTIFLPVVALAAYMGSQAVFFERNMSHAVPLYLLGSGLGLTALVETQRRHRWCRPLFLILVVAAALVPSEISWRMVYSGFSGRFEKARARDLARFLSPSQFPVVDGNHLVVVSSDDDPWFQRKWEDNPSPYIVLWSDVDPEFTRQCVLRLHSRFRFEERAVLPGLFDELRGPNTLRDYLCRTLRGYVFYGRRGIFPGVDDGIRASPLP